MARRTKRSKIDVWYGETTLSFRLRDTRIGKTLGLVREAIERNDDDNDNYGH